MHSVTKCGACETECLVHSGVNYCQLMRCTNLDNCAPLNLATPYATFRAVFPESIRA